MERFGGRGMWLGAWVLAMAATCLASSGRGRHRKVYAVPSPGKVTIDAKLDDWDLSGQIHAYVIQETADEQGAHFALMHDAEALYLSAVVRDLSPLMNRHDPKVDGDKGWDADSCQFRMVLDAAQGYPVNQSSFSRDKNDQLVHLTLWYYTDRKEPCLQMHFGMDFALPKAGYGPHGVVPAGKFQAAYAAAADGKGYTFEYRIPWSTLEARTPPKAGDAVAGTVQFNFSAADGLKTAGGAAWAYDVMNGPGFPFQSSSCWGRVLFAKEGKVSRELVEEGAPPVRPAPLEFEYDLPEAGEATVSLFDDSGLCVRTLAASAPRPAGRNVERWDGCDGLGKPLPPGTYRWRGLIHQPLKTKFILAVHNSGQPPYKTDDDTGGWGGDHGVVTDVCAVPGGIVASWNVCESGWGIIRTDLAGRKKWGSKHSATFLATDGKRIFAAGGHGFETARGVQVLDLADCRPLNWGSGSPVLTPPKVGPEIKVRRPKLPYQPARGYADRTDDVTGLAYGGGKVFVAYGGSNAVGVYDAASGKLQETWGVPSAGRLAARPDGSILAVSAREVVAVEAGVVSPLALNPIDEPASVAAAPDGAIYVANRGERQDITVFSAKGEHLRTIGRLGGRPAVGTYDPNGILEPGGIALDERGRLWVAEMLDGPKRISVWDGQTGKLTAEYFGGSAYSTFVWMDPQRGDEVFCHNVVWRIDLASGAWRPASTCWRGKGPNSIGGIGGEFNSAMRVITARNGRQYAWAYRHAIGPILFLREGDLFKPLLHFIRCIDGHILTPWPPYPMMADRKRFPTGGYVWADRNDDQVMQAEELHYFGSRGERAGFDWVDADLALWSGGGQVWRPVRIEPNGRPIYDFTKPQAVPVRGNNGHGPLVVDPQDGSLYTNAPDSDPGWARWTPEGKMLWGYRGTVSWPKAVNLPPLRPGDLFGPTCPLGVAGDFTGIASYFGPFHLFTRDGLYVGMIFRDGRRSGLGPDLVACENFAGQLVRPAGMDRYFLLTGDQDGRITEVLGLETVKRLAGGTCILTADDAKTAAEALARHEADKARAQRLTIVHGKGGLAAAGAVGKAVDEQRSFLARAAWDDKNLYVAYEVDCPHEMVNAMPDPKLIFKGGNLMDVQLAADAAADPKRKAPAPGDVRVLIGRREGKCVAVVFRPKVAGSVGEPTVLKSPTGQESLDAIEATDRVTLEYRKRSGGFEATATIPLDLLGWRPAGGSTVRMDLGFLFGNATGTRTAARAYWHNNSFTANVADDIPHESRLEPAEWGDASVE